jgi:hypothetical protein
MFNSQQFCGSDLTSLCNILGNQFYGIVVALERPSSLSKSRFDLHAYKFHPSRSVVCEP